MQETKLNDRKLGKHVMVKNVVRRDYSHFLGGVKKGIYEYDLDVQYGKGKKKIAKLRMITSPDYEELLSSISKIYNNMK